jgi:hypothetical protein
VPIGDNDVNILDGTTNDKAFTAGSVIDVEVTAEVGRTPHGGGGRHTVRMAVTGAWRACRPE